MSESLLYTLIVFFTVISVGLALFVWKLLLKNKEMNRQYEDSLQKHADAAQEQKNYIIDSIRIISRGIIDEQCPLTEGCIRLKVLIDNYAPQLHQLPDLQVVELMYGKTSHIPTLDAWKRLSSIERISFQKEIDLLEKKYRDDIHMAAKFLKEYPFEQRAH